jgi:Flp pilus assembly protein TadG
MPSNVIKRLIKNGKELRTDENGAILIEFAYCLPLLVAFCFTGIEAASITVANMRVSQIATSVADNMSRAKQSVPSALPQLREVDINDAFLGAKVQGGDNMPILTKGRIIVSSLQRNSNDKQTIAWQRCKGKKVVASSYGAQGATQPNSGTSGFQGMGPSTALVKAEPNSAIIFVELTYDYVPLVSASLLGTRTIRHEAAFYVRDDRDLTGGPESNGVWNPAPEVTTAKKAACNTYNDTF